jgi:hypothetical protein
MYVHAARAPTYCVYTAVCVNNGDFDTNTYGNAIECTIGGVSVCRSGYSCQTTIPGSTSGYCCLGTGGAENGMHTRGMIPCIRFVAAGCPPRQFVYKDLQGFIPTCNPYATPTGCVNTYSCQFSNTRQQYQCCGDSPVASQSTTQAALGCPGLQQAFVDPATGQARVCSSLSSQVCPVGYYCQYASTGVIQCCGLQGGMLNGVCVGTYMCVLSVSGRSTRVRRFKWLTPTVYAERSRRMWRQL